MINAILKGIMSLIMGLVSTLLTPIDALITQFLPSLGNAISAIGSMLNYATSLLGYVVDCTCLSSEALSLIVVYFTFKLTVPVLVSGIKQAIKWYNALKP